MEEIYLSPDGLYEYSLVELEQAAKEDNITVQEFISSRGFKLKGGGVEETIEVEEKKPEPKDTPAEKPKSNVPDWAFDAAGIVDPIQTKAELLMKKQPEGKELYEADSKTLTLQGDIAKDNVFYDEEDVALKDFEEAYTSGQFNNWLQSPDQIKAAENQAKTEELVVKPSIQTALINDEYTVQDIRDFQSVGVKDLPDVSNIDVFKDPNANISSYDNDSFFQDGIVEQTREALKKSNIYNTFEKANAELNSDKRFDYVSNIIRNDNSEISEKELPRKVNDFLLNNMVETSDDRAKSYLGSDLYNKYLKADSKGKNEILKEKFNSNNIEALVDDKGNFVDTSRVSPKQKEEIVTKQVDEIQEYSNMGTQSLLKLFKSAEDEVASLATTLVKVGEDDINDAGFLFPRFVESGKKPLFGLTDDYVDPRFTQLQFMAKTGVVPKGLKYLTKGDNQLVNDYNKALRKLQTIQLAVGLNVDLTKLDRESTGDILSEEWEKAFGFESLGINEMQNTLLYEMQDELGFEAKKEEIARLGLPGELYVKQPNLDDQGNIVRDDQGNIEYDAINYERMLSTLPGFTKMSMEIAGTFFISGGVGNVAKITTGIGDLVALNMARYGMSSKAALQFGKFSAGVLQESYGLVGSNTIGSNLFGSEKMPVIPFAVGSQLGHLGINWLGKVIPKGIARYATENQAFGNVVDFVNKMPGGSTIGGAVKFATAPAISATAIKGGEFTSGLLDVAKGEQSMTELWHHVTDVDSFIETYGALLFMSAAHPTQLMKKAVDNFQYDMLKLQTDMPSWNKLALDLGLETKKTGSWSRSEVNKAVDKLSNEIASNPELSPAEARQQLANVKAQGKRLGIKRQLDIEANKAENIENWNTTYKNLQRTINSIGKGNKINVTDITNLVEAGIANGGASPILELKTIGLDSKTATDLYKFSQTSYNEAQNYFKDVNSSNFKSYVESGITEMNAKNAKDNLNTMLKDGTISNAAYNTQLAEVESVIELETAKQENLIDLAKGDTEVRIKETRDYADQVIAEGSEVKELNNEEYIKLKSSLGGKENTSVGFGFQTVIDGKPTFVINKDVMVPNKGEYRFESGGKEYVVKGFQGSTLKHEVFHPVFENKFSAESVERRAAKLAGIEGDIDAARETIIRQDIEYIDQFKERLKELGVFNRVEQEMKLRPGYNELITKGERSVEIEKEFINEFLELQNEGALNNLVKDIKFKEVSADVITELKNGADVADYFFTGVEQTAEGKAKVKEAQEAYKELVKDGDVTIQLSEKKADELAKEYKNGTIGKDGIKNLVKQYNNIGLKALGYDVAKGDIPSKNAVSFINKEFVSILERYDGSTKLSTWINSNIRPKRQEFYEGEIGDKAKTTSIDSETAKQVADTSTPETIAEGKESEVKEVERQISTFEGKEANRKKKEILEVVETIELQDMKPGVGGAPKKQVGEIGELIFEVPADKISDPRKNLTFAKKLINLETGNVAKPGEKGVISDSEFGNIQKFFSDKSNMKRFIKTLPETNVTSEEAIVNKQGESIDVSREVVGRGIGLPNRIIKYFYEPTGKRSKGLTSQTAVYKIKPEFKNATPETIAKVQGDLLIGKDLKTYDRTVNGQLAKGMAMVEAMKIANEATRSKMPVETAAEKKLVADIKAGASKLSMSEKIITPVAVKRVKIGEGFKNRIRKKGLEHIEEQLGTKEMIPNIVKKLKGPIAKAFGNILTRRGGLLGSAVWNNSGARVTSAFRDGMPLVGNYEAKIKSEAIKNLVKQEIKNPSKSQIKKAEKAVANTEAMRITREALDAGLTMENNVLADLVKQSVINDPKLSNKYTPEQLKKIGLAIDPQRESKLKTNVKNLKDFEEGKELLMDAYKDVLTESPESIDVVTQMIYHKNSNSHPNRNLATYLGTESNISKRPQLKNKPYEEHTLPFGEAMTLMVDVINSTNSDWKGFKKWMHNNYFQEGISAAPKGEPVYGYSKEILDQPVRTKGKNGEDLPAWASKDQLHPELKKQSDEAKAGKRKWDNVISADIRKYNEYKSDRGYINPNTARRVDFNTGEIISDAKRYNVEVDSYLENNPSIIKIQNDLIYRQLIGEITPAQAKAELAEFVKARGTKEADLAFKNNKSELDKPGVMNTSEKMTTEELVEKARTIDKALQMADRPNMPKKKIRIFDFDDTVARTNSKVFAEREGERIELTAEEFAEKGMELIDQGYEMDFTDFNRVVEGKKGPLFDLIKKLKEAPGERDLFILTARAPESQQAIFEFMKAMGVEIPLENITGLGNSTGEAKANWIIDKAAEGYNDFYFADDAPQNVKAVKTAMSQLDVKSKVQLAKENKINFSEKKTKELDWKTDKAGNIKTTFNIGKKKYNFNLDARDSKGSFDVEFNLGGRIDMTGTGDAVKVIRTVYNGLLDIVGKTPEIKRLEFSSLKSETSRVKLYTTLMDRVAKKLGWETDIWESNDFITPDKSSYDFEITKPRKKQVAPVEKALNVIDVKSKVQKARLNTSEKMNTTFNEILEQSTGIDAVKVFSDVKAQVRGGKKKGQKFFIPPSAEDFLGLLYTTMPKGKKGEKAMKFYQDALLDPYTRAMTNLSTSRVNLMADFKALKKQLDVPKDLKKETESGFTNEQAVRVYLWNKVGEKIPGLSKTDLKELSDIVEKDPKLKVFADEILSITKGDGYSKPGEGWANGTITTDLVDILNTTKRGKYLETWKENVDVVFSKDNLNKLEAAYGKKYREAVENSLSRMKKGSNRVAGGNRLSNQVLDYINNSTGVTMFINARSALLQTISAANFINWSFNNPYQAGKAFANQPQFWKDFKQLINSDYLKDRRNGLKLNISESEIANAAKTSKNKAKAVLSYILEKGYAPTKYADSFAIAFGGASYYRNRVKDLMRNKGMSEAEANKQALIDWRAESEKSQQSSDPSKISAQQSSDLGRVILQYVNTPMQYARMQKRDVQDIVNKRAMPGKTLAQSNRVRVSRIIYYAAIQNMVFNALQQGLFSLGFGDSDISDDEQKKIVNAANGMLDSSLRGLGVGGVTVQVLKNLGIDIYRRSQKDRPEYVDAWIKLLEFSPAIKSKLGRFKSAAYPFDNKKKREEVFEKGFALNNPAYESGAKVITAVTNVPVDRVISKTNNLISAFDEDTEAWMSVAMILGWPEWQLQDKGNDNKKDKNKNPFAITKKKSNNPFAITKKKDNNPFAIK